MARGTIARITVFRIIYFRGLNCPHSGSLNSLASSVLAEMTMNGPDDNKKGIDAKKIRGPIDAQNLEIDDIGETITNEMDSGFFNSFRDPTIVRKVGKNRIELLIINNWPLK